MFSSNHERSCKAYLDFIVKEDSELICAFYEKKILPAIVGRTEFIDWAKNTFFATKSHKQVPDSNQLAPAIEQIKMAVCQDYGVTTDQLMCSIRGISNEPRNVAIYLTRMLRQDGLMEIGVAFGMRGYSSASSAIVRVRKKLLNDNFLHLRISRIKKLIVSTKR